jgi:hypothetical protein
MNRYGRMALEYHRRFLPRAFAEIRDPERFFAEAGDEIETAISDMRDEILGRQRPGETLEEFRLRSYQALRTAEEVVLADHHLLTADPEPTDEDPTISDDPELAEYFRDLAEVNETIARIYE